MDIDGDTQKIDNLKLILRLLLDLEPKGSFAYLYF